VARAALPTIVPAVRREAIAHQAAATVHPEVHQVAEDHIARHPPVEEEAAVQAAVVEVTPDAEGK